MLLSWVNTERRVVKLHILIQNSNLFEIPRKYENNQTTAVCLGTGFWFTGCIQKATSTLAGCAATCNLSDNFLVVDNKPYNNEVAFKTKRSITKSTERERVSK